MNALENERKQGKRAGEKNMSCHKGLIDEVKYRKSISRDVLQIEAYPLDIILEA